MDLLELLVESEAFEKEVDRRAAANCPGLLRKMKQEAAIDDESEELERLEVKYSRLYAIEQKKLARELIDEFLEG